MWPTSTFFLCRELCFMVWQFVPAPSFRFWEVWRVLLIKIHAYIVQYHTLFNTAVLMSSWYVSYQVLVLSNKSRVRLHSTVGIICPSYILLATVCCDYQAHLLPCNFFFTSLAYLKLSCVKCSDTRECAGQIPATWPAPAVLASQPICKKAGGESLIGSVARAYASLEFVVLAVVLIATTGI